MTTQDNTLLTKNPLEENPYLSRGLSLEGLIHNLKGHHPEWCGGMLRDMDNLRLEAIVDQATNVEDTVNRSLRSLGVTLAVAMNSGELEDSHVINIGWLIEFLAEVSDVAHICIDNGNGALKQNAQAKSILQH
jgi:hypothetical protein